MVSITPGFYTALLLLLHVNFLHAEADLPVEEEKYGVKYADECEVCKYVVVELENKLKETGKSREVIKTGYGLEDNSKKTTKYAKSELRLLESLDGICDRLLEYNIHKERKDSTRFAKGMSTTFKVLHGLVDKGVKVELGIPYELWDKPSAEVTNLKSQCENMIEKHESDIEDWYFNHQDIPLKQFICIDRALKKGDTGCLQEISLQEEDKESTKKRKKKHKTPDSGKNTSSDDKLRLESDNKKDEL